MRWKNIRLQGFFWRGVFVGYLFYQNLREFFVYMFKPRQDVKVFCIGNSKTGTSSLNKALSILGYRSLHFPRFGIAPKIGWVEYISRLHFDAFTDLPFHDIETYQALEKRFPGCKFILTVRDSVSWKKSLFQFLKGSPLELSSSEMNLAVKEYEEGNKQARAYFKDKKNFLEMNIFEGDCWQELCEFLNKPVPNKKFPHKNINWQKIPVVHFMWKGLMYLVRKLGI
jgi:hypothetical protein